MAGKNINQDRDNSIAGELLTKQDNEKEWQKLVGFEIPQADTSENPAAQSQWSTGRQCPRCAHRLVMFELNTDSGILHIECRHCGGRWGHEQLESPDSDEMYRQIPDDVKIRWMQARENEMKRKGIW